MAPSVREPPRSGRAGAPPAPAAPAAPAPARVPASGKAVHDNAGGDDGAGASLVGRVIGDKYGVTSVIGEGGMGAVYEAEHLQIGRLVAVKVLHPKEAQKPEAVSRLEHEARVAGRIGHPNICEVYDMGRLPDGSPYLVMERLHGETLADRIQRIHTVPPHELVDIMLQVLSALVTAHERGIIHRDLKPENIFLSERAGMLPVAKLLDFGISKTSGIEETAMNLTRTGMVMGTPYYMAPEQARGDRELDHRVDLWAVGVILYEALTGHRPFVARNYNALLVQILTLWHRPVTELNTSIPASLSRIVDRALAKAREERFQSARDFLEALRRFKKRSGTHPPRRPAPSPERVTVQKLADESSEDGTMMFARVQDFRGLKEQQAIVGLGPRDPDAAAAPEPLRELAVLPPPARAVRVHSEGPSSSRGRQLRVEEIEDPPTTPAPPAIRGAPPRRPAPPAPHAPPPDSATRPPGSGREDAESTVVDPPAFMEDSITVVRRDVRSRGDRG